jgi:hypothetical protein
LASPAPSLTGSILAFCGKEVDIMNIRPLHDRVIIKRIEEYRTSPGGTVIPETAAEKPIQGEVTAVSTGKIL